MNIVLAQRNSVSRTEIGPTIYIYITWSPKQCLATSSTLTIVDTHCYWSSTQHNQLRSLVLLQSSSSLQTIRKSWLQLYGRSKLWLEMKPDKNGQWICWSLRHRDVDSGQFDGIFTRNSKNNLEKVAMFTIFPRTVNCKDEPSQIWGTDRFACTSN